MNIIELAKQAHRKLVTEVYVGHMGQLDPWTVELLKIFADLVAADEREALEKIDWTALMREGSLVTRSDAQELGDRILAAIRARGTT